MNQDVPIVIRLGINVYLVDLRIGVRFHHRPDRLSRLVFCREMFHAHKINELFTTFYEFIQIFLRYIVELWRFKT